MEAARGSQGTVEGSKCPPSFACQLSAFPGQCPPVVRLLFLFSVFARQFVFPVPCPPVVRLPCTLPTSSPPSQDPAHQLSAFPGPCPPVVGLPWTLPASCPPSLDPARQLFVDPARQLSAFPGPFPPAVHLPWTLPASCLPSPAPCPPVVRLPWTLPVSCPPSHLRARNSAQVSHTSSHGGENRSQRAVTLGHCWGTKLGRVSQKGDFG